MRRAIGPRVYFFARSGGALAILALPLVLGGCAGVVAAGTAIGAAGGSLALANETAQLTGSVLTDSAKLACALQALANAEGDAQFSKAAGQFCVW